MTGLVILLILSNLAWFTAYCIRANTAKRVSHEVTAGPIFIKGYSTRDTLAILDVLERKTK